MALNLFIAYGNNSDQTTALRLQALGGVNGINVYVPPSHTRSNPFTTLDPQAWERLRAADVVLGIITFGMSESCRHELNTAKALGRKTIVMAEPTIASQLEPFFPGSVLVVNPLEPAQAEFGIVEFLKRTEMEQNAKTAVLALGTLALGLLIFAPQD